MAYTASQQGRYCVPDQLIDGSSTITYKWFSLHNNKLDGTYHPLSSSGSYQIGWWGTSLSDSVGSISSAPNIVSTFPSRPLNSIIIAGDEDLNEYPVDFVYKLYNSIGTLLYTKTVTANSLLRYIEYFPATYLDVTKIDLTVTKISRVNSVVKITEAFDYGQIHRTDALTPRADDTTVSIGSQLVKTDILTPRLDDLDNGITSTDVGVDALTPRLDDLDNGITNNDIAIDTLTPKTDDIDNGISSNQITTDLLTPMAADIDNGITSSSTATDILAPLLADIDNGITNNDIAYDSMLVKIDEFIPYKAYGSIDNVLSKIDDVTISTLSTDIAYDILTPKTDEFVSYKKYGSTDTVTPNTDDMDNVITSSQTTTDIVLINPLIDDTIIFNSTDIQPYANGDQLSNNISDVPFKWFNLHNSILDGSFHPIDSTESLEIGWWSTTVSDDAGNFSTPIRATLKFADSVISTLKVVGDTPTNNYPVNFTINLYDIYNNVLGTYNITDNTQVNYTASIMPVANVVLLEIIITAISNPHEPLKIIELYPLARTTIVGNSIGTTDNLLVLFTDNDTINSSQIGVDILAPKLDDLDNSITSNQRTTDSILPNITDTDNGITNNSTRADIITPKLDDFDNGITNTNTTIDTLTPLLADMDNGIASNQITADIMLPKLDEANPGINSASGTSDILTPKLDSVINTTNSSGSSDILTPLVSDIDNGIINNDIAYDTLLPNVSEIVNSSQVLASTQEVLTPNIIETVNSITLPISTVEVLTPKLSEIDNQTVSGNSSDTILPMLSDMDNGITNNDIAYDTMTPMIIEGPSTETVSAPASDNLTPMIVDNNNGTSVNANTIDMLKPKADDMLLYKQFGSIDNVKVVFIESLTINNSFSSFDSLQSLLLDATNYIGTKFYSQDSVNVKVVEQGGDIHVSFTSTTGLDVRLDEDLNMTNVHTKMDETSRRIYGKVEIVYSDPFVDTLVNYIASSVNASIDIKSVADGQKITPYKWFSLFDNKLDGTFHPMDYTKKLSTGWWGSEISDDLGNFINTQYIEAYFTARPIIQLNVSGDATSDVYPVDFTIQLYDANNNVLYVETVSNNDQYDWSKMITQIDNVTRMRLEITRINRRSVAKITEFFTTVVREYDQEQIMSMHLLEELDYVDNEIPVGAISANEIDVVLSNEDKQFSINNPNSALCNLLKKNRKLTAWLGVEVIEGTIEWHKLGVFWTTKWRTPQRQLMTTVTARDALDLLRQEEFEKSDLYINYTVAQLYEVLFESYGFSSDEYSIDPALSSITIPYAWFDRMTYKDALSRLSSAVLVKVFCNRDGVIIVKKLGAMENSRYTFDEDKNYYDSDFPTLGTDVTNYVEVIVNTLTTTSPTIIYDLNTPISIQANTTQTITCIYNQTPNIDVQNPTVDHDTGIGIGSINAYAWGMEVQLTNPTDSDLNVNRITIVGTPLRSLGATVCTAQDTMSILSDGKIKSTLNCPFIQTVEYANQLANEVLQTYRDQQKDVVLDSRGNIAIAIGDVVKVQSEFDPGTDYTVFRQTIDWDGALSAQVEGKRV